METIALEQELKQTRVENKSTASKKKEIEPVVSFVVPEPFQVIPFQHQYSIGHVMLYLSLVLSASISLRGAGRV